MRNHLGFLSFKSLSKNAVGLGLLLVQGTAWAQATTTTVATAAAQQPPVNSFLLNLPIIVAVMALFYFGILRPQKQQQKTQTEFLKQLNRGDEVVTASGIIGKIVGMTDRVVTLEVCPQTELKILRSQVQGLLKDSVQPEQNK